MRRYLLPNLELSIINAGIFIHGSMHVEREVQKLDTQGLIQLHGIMKIQEKEPLKQEKRNRMPTEIKNILFTFLLFLKMATTAIAINGSDGPFGEAKGRIVVHH